MVSSHVSLRPMISKFSAWVSTMISSILGGSDCTFARNTFNLLLVCAWALADGGGDPGASGGCGGWGGPPCGGSPSCSPVAGSSSSFPDVGGGGVLVVSSWFGSHSAPEVHLSGNADTGAKCPGACSVEAHSIVEHVSFPSNSQ